MDSTEGKRKYKKLLISTYSQINRSNFLQRCIEEKVIPKSTPYKLLSTEHIFPQLIQDHLQNAAKELKLAHSSSIKKVHALKSTLLQEQILTNIEEQTIKRLAHRTSNIQKTNLSKKLTILCNKSKWNTIGRPELITNISTYLPTKTEIQALSLGLKFATGLPNHSITNLISKNYRQTDTEFFKGFIQGILTTTTNSSNHDTTIPKRFSIALKKLANNTNLHITSSDKGGGVVIMDRNTYINKMNSLLEDNNIYTTTDIKTIKQNTTKFNKTYKNLIKGEDKYWSTLIEHHPRTPTLYGLPKTHKQNIPMRPITSGIGSAPHKIARAIAKILTPLLGTLSPAHIKNSGDLLQKLKNINISEMSLASLDVQSLYTNVPVGKCLEQLKIHLVNLKPDIPLPIDTIIEICTLCTDLTHFEFDGQLYQQKFGLPMGSPISGILACIYLEFLESGPFRKIFPSNIHYFRYIDDALIIYPNNTNLPHLVNNLNKIEPTINFTSEIEKNNSLPFLDILLHKANSKLQFSVYRKPTNKDDLINFHSHHHIKIKTGIIIGFYLRAFRICSPGYLQNELHQIENTFTSLHYPSHIIHHARRKAHIIYKKSTTTKNTQDINNPTRRIILPTNNISTNLSQNNHKFQQFNIVPTTSKTIAQIITKNTTKHTDTTAGVYKIPCAICPKAYYGETSRSLKNRIYEHKRDLINNNTQNAMVIHRNQTNHNPNFTQAQIIAKIHDTKPRQITESAFILTQPSNNLRPGFYSIARDLAMSIISKYKTQYDTG